MSGYVIGQIQTYIRGMLDRIQVGQRDAMLYNTFLSNINNTNSDLFRSLVGHLTQATNNQWQAGIHPDSMYAILKPWVNDMLNRVDAQLQQQRGPVWGGPQQHGGMGAFQAQAPYATTTTAYAPISPPIQPANSAFDPPPIAAAPDILNTTGKSVMFELHKASPVDIKLPEHSILSLKEYMKGEYENERLSAFLLELTVSENIPRDAARRAFNHAPQEIVRGLYATMVHYDELFHVPIGLGAFRDILTVVGEAYYREKNWGQAISALEQRNRSEWAMFSTMLCRLLNQFIHRRLRTSDRAVIEGIEAIDDLTQLADRHSTLTVTHHSRYWTVFNGIVMRAFEDILNPKHLVTADDEYFGDFIHCDAVEYYFAGHTKYDYGAFIEAADRDQFRQKLLANNTVLRLPRTLIMTNALDMRLVQQVENYSNAQQLLLSDANTIGTTLLDKLHYPEISNVDALICFERNVSPEKYMRQINLGRTLDDEFVLLR